MLLDVLLERPFNVFGKDNRAAWLCFDIFAPAR
jgi:hypothetical protein